MNIIGDIFPNVELPGKDSMEEQNLQIQAFGKRITKDQTVPEYLLEFLLIFIGENQGKSGFDKFNYSDTKFLKYEVNPNIGLKRFIFFENSKLDNRFDIDAKAYEALRKELEHSINSKGHYLAEDILDMIQELFYGFSSVTKNRGWFAQSMMPICKETIFPEAMGKKSQRANLNFDDNKKAIDTKFEFKEHNFMARGGEVYYLHMMQGLEENAKLKENIQNQIKKLIDSYPQISTIAQWINNKWNDFMIEHTGDEEYKDKLKENIESKWITSRYKRRSKYTVEELNNLLMCETSEFEKIDLLNTAIVVQILRMMVESSACIVNEKEESNPMWLMHIPSISRIDNKVKKLAIESYKSIEECMELSISKMLLLDKQNGNKNNKKNKSDLTRLKKANEDSFKLLRKLGKDIGLIIPLRGESMRFTMNDSITRFLVLSIVEPDTKITLNRFLKKLYDHFGIVIGPDEYYRYIENNNLKNNIDVSFLNYNLLEFQNLLRKNGFLRELSDAISIVENPYKKMEELVYETICSNN